MYAPKTQNDHVQFSNFSFKRISKCKETFYLMSISYLGY